MISASLLDQTAARFPHFFRDRIRIEPLEKGGSDRKYYRIAVCGEGSLILVKYGSQREENRHGATDLRKIIALCHVLRGGLFAGGMLVHTAWWR